MQASALPPLCMSLIAKLATVFFFLTPCEHLKKPKVTFVWQEDRVFRNRSLRRLRPQKGGKILKMTHLPTFLISEHGGNMGHV
jgi:hypothetical protein